MDDGDLLLGRLLELMLLTIVKFLLDSLSSFFDKGLRD